MNTRTISIANGLPIHMIAGLRDEDDKSLLYLNVMGSPQAVRSNWAALKSGGAKPYIRPLGGIVQLKKQQHLVFNKVLPCGWTNMIMLHKQLSVPEVDTQEDFYFLDLDYENTSNRNKPANFYAMLSKVMPFPVLPEWQDYIWDNAWRYSLLKSMWDRLNCKGIRASNNVEKWAQVIRMGFNDNELTLEGLKSQAQETHEQTHEISPSNIDDPVAWLNDLTKMNDSVDIGDILGHSSTNGSN